MLGGNAKNWFLLWLAAVVLTLCLSGCGGGGGGGSDSVASGATAQLRQLRVGDTWEHSTTLTMSGTTKHGTALTQLRPTIGTDPRGNTYRVLGEVPTGGDSTSIALRFISQDATGTIYDHGGWQRVLDCDVTWYVTSPASGSFVYIKSPFRVGDVHRAEMQTDTGLSEVWSYGVVAEESVTVPAGTFRAYKIEGDCIQTYEGGGYAAVYTMWWVPEVGWYVKLVQSSATSTYTETLISYSLAQ